MTSKHTILWQDSDLRFGSSLSLATQTSHRYLKTKQQLSLSKGVSLLKVGVLYYTQKELMSKKTLAYSWHQFSPDF